MASSVSDYYVLEKEPTACKVVDLTKGESVLKPSCDVDYKLYTPGKYGNPVGDPALIHAFVEKCSKRALSKGFRGDLVSPSHVQVVSGGATQGLAIAASILPKGSEIVVLAPFFPLIPGIFSHAGLSVVVWDIGSSKSSFEEVFTTRTSAVYLNSPNNPMGSSVRSDVLEAVSRAAKTQDITVIHDEAYENFVDLAPFWFDEDLYLKSLVIHTMSKGYGIPGSRIGFIHTGNVKFASAIREKFLFTCYCPPAGPQLEALNALESNDTWIDDASTLYWQNYRKVAALFESIQLYPLKPVVMPIYFFVDMSPYFPSKDSLLKFLLDLKRATGIMLAPGSLFGNGYECFIRISCSSLPDIEMEKALLDLEEFFKGNLGRFNARIQSAEEGIADAR